MVDFASLDPDEQALVKKPRPIGWFFAILILVAALGFAGGVYLPLSQAHATLLTAHEQLAKKSSELDETLKGETESLKTCDTTRTALTGFVTGGAEKERALTNRISMNSATVENDLQPFIQAKLVTLEPTESEIRVTLAEKLVFRPGGGTVSPQAKRPVCGVAKAVAQEKDWVIRALIRGPSSDKKYWATVGERTGSLAEFLENRCGVDVAQIESVATKVADAAKGEVRLVVGPREQPCLRGAQAPLPKKDP